MRFICRGRAESVISRKIKCEMILEETRMCQGSKCQDIFQILLANAMLQCVSRSLYISTLKFLTVGMTDLLGQIDLCGRPPSCALWVSSASLAFTHYMATTHSPQAVARKTSPNIAKCPLRAESPWVENSTQQMLYAQLVLALISLEGGLL